MGDTLDLATKDPDTPSGDTSAPEKVERHRVSLTAWRLFKQPSDQDQLQESRHQDTDSKIESKESTKEDTPVGL